MWTVKPKTDMQSMTRYNNKKSAESENNKNCYIKMRPVNSKVCADKKYQATNSYKKVDKNCQISDMQPMKPEMNMQ